MKSQITQRRIHFGADRLPYTKEVPRHQHIFAYATLVLEGRFEQLSYAGRLVLHAGDVLINPTFDCHANKMVSRGITLTRLPWRQEATFGGVYRNLAIDLVRRVAMHDPVEASGLLAEQVVARDYAPFAARDWPEKLAADLRDSPRLHISQWADAQGLSREYVWRCFQCAFGVAPVQFRSEINARAALLNIIRSDKPLSTIASDFGFSDQSHMTRAIRALTGASPGYWRGSHSFKTDITELVHPGDGNRS
jgi:AraC-like DNA-binding protein